MVWHLYLENLTRMKQYMELDLLVSESEDGQPYLGE
jgi:hypothetical protein